MQKKNEKIDSAERAKKNNKTKKRTRENQKKTFFDF